MRLLKLRVRGFRRLRDATFDLDHERLLVVGGNEAGKTTLVEAIQVGIYGLAPARRGSGHGLALRLVAPWDGIPAGLALTYRLDSGRTVEADWDLSGERVQVIDLDTGEDVSQTFSGGTHGWLDCGAELIGIPGAVFNQV